MELLCTPFTSLRARLQLATALLLLTGHAVMAAGPGTSPSPNDDTSPKRATGSRTAAPDLSIGRRVFVDNNRNGIQDAGEPGVANLPIKLYQNGIQRGQTSTDANGEYSFSTGLLPNTAYEVRVSKNDFPAGLTLTKRAQGTDRTLDSDALLVGNVAVAYVTTGSTGSSLNASDIGLAAGTPDLVLTQTANNARTSIGASTTFTIQVSNAGDAAANNVVVRDTLDAGLTLVSTSPAASISTTPSSQTVLTWNLNTLQPSGSASLSVVLRANAEGILYNTAYVSTTDTELSTRNNVYRSGVTVPIKMCQDEAFVASLPDSYTGVRWYRNSETTPVGNGNSLTITAAGSYSYTANNGDCAITACVPIIVEDGIVPTLAITPASPAICVGGTTSLSATGCTNGTIAWSTGATTASIPVSPTATTTYSFTCTPTTYGYCPASASVSVTVNPLPAPAITVSSATVCAGGTITLTSSVGDAYKWSTGETSRAISVTASGTYSLTMTSTAGCSATTSTSVTVNAAPALAIGSATLCAGQNTVLTVSGCEGGTLLWSTGDTPVSLTVAPLVTTTYSATCTFQTGCSATISSTIVVNPTPTYDTPPTVTLATCAGATARNDARIAFTALQNVERADIVLGGEYGSGPAYGATTNVAVANGSVSFANLPNPNIKQAYTVRLFSAGGTCQTDVVVMLDPAVCICQPTCVPIRVQRIR